jgi:hypothetical protein
MRIFKYLNGLPYNFYDIGNYTGIFKGFDNNLTPCHILCRGIIIDILRAKRKRIFKQI